MRGTDQRRLAERAAFLALLLCSACTAIGTAQPKLQDFKTVGIISAIGDTLTLTSSGLTSKNEEQSLSIEPWGIDDLITSRVSAMLTRHYQVQPVTYDRAAFVAAYKRDNPVVAVNLVHNLLHENPIKDLVRKQAGLQGLDAYVVITKAPSAYGTRGHKVAGIGIIKYARLLDSYVELYALYKISVVDGHEFKIIAERSASPLDNTETVRLEGPSRLVDNALLPAANDAASNEPLKTAVTDLIERSLPATLEGLRLADPS